MDKKLLALFKKFDSLCKKHGIEYNIVSDERDRQGYLIKRADVDKSDKVEKGIQDLVDEQDIHMGVDQNHRDGILFTFTLKAIQEDGLTPELSRMVDYTVADMLTALRDISNAQVTDTCEADTPDVQKEQRKKGLFMALLCRVKQKIAAHEAAEQGVDITEDQYKWSTGKVRRKQSMFPQSFGRTRSYGGVINGHAKIAPTRVAWKGRTSSEMTEDVKRIRDIDKLFMELIAGTEARDDNKIRQVGYVLSELAAGSESLQEITKDAINCALYHDINDVGYAYDRFRKVFITKPIVETPDSDPTLIIGDSVVVKEQFEVSCDKVDVAIPVGTTGIVEQHGVLTTIAFNEPSINATMSPYMVSKYLTPTSNKFTNRIDTAIINETHKQRRLREI